MIAEHCKKQVQSQQGMDWQVHEVKDSLIKKEVTVPETT
jgi:hypothetical protein